MTGFSRVTVLVDWDTARRLTRWPSDVRPKHIEAVFERLQTAIAHYLHNVDRLALYRVNWRVYHGWYRGKTKTADRRVFDEFALAATTRTIRNVSFGGDYVTCEHLVSGTSRNPLYDTLRADEKTGEDRQKMVDTSLVCDLLCLVRSRDSRIYILIADDDDFVPALFTAEAWQASVVMLHNRDNTNSHLELRGLSERIHL